MFAPHNPIGVCAKPFHHTGRGERLLAISLTIQSADSIHGRAMLAPTIEMRTNPVGATMQERCTRLSICAFAQIAVAANDVRSK